MSLEAIIYGPFRLDVDSGQLFRLDVPVGEPLSDTELKVLSKIMAYKGEVAPFSEFGGPNKDAVNWYVHTIVDRTASAYCR